MNLHALASGLIAAVNPTVVATVTPSTGSTQNADGTRTPTYGYPQTVPAQVQSLTFGDLRQVEGLNLQGTKYGIYLYGRIEGLLRTENRGGDLIKFPDGKAFPYGTVWLTAMVLEQYPDWCKVAAVLQNNS